jgi:hypothetical protein
MIYEQAITIPKLTQRAAPVSEVIPVHPGTVKQVEVFFPPGCAGLAHVTIWYWERQVWPGNPDGYFTGDGQSLTFPEDLELTDQPYSFTVKGWNEDDTYSHTPIVRVTVVPFDRDLVNLFQSFARGPSGPVTSQGG